MGCERCHVGSPAICCDIHNPSEFSSFASVIAKQPLIPPRSHITKYERTQTDIALRDALQEWRENTTAMVFGRAHLIDMGPSILMCKSTLERIVDCAHHHKINSVSDLKRETGWPDADQFGSEIITLIHAYSPSLPSPFVSTPLRPTTSMAVNTPPALPDRCPTPCPSSASTVQKRKNKCSACGQEGHNGMLAWLLVFFS